jgi:Ser/Thr protein kinase RdoA (MazF antagonist)
MSEAQHPFSQLTPDLVLDSLESVGFEVDGRLSALSSYENRVYLAHCNHSQPVVAKFYRPKRWSEKQIEEEHAFTHELMENEIPVIGSFVVHDRTLHQVASKEIKDFYFSVSPYRGGRRPELEDPMVLEWIGRFIARIHSVGEQQGFIERPFLDCQTFGVDPCNYLLRNQIIPIDLESRWKKLSSEALKIAEGIFKSCSPRNLRLHGDCHPGNILWTPIEMQDGGPHFVDLDDSRMGPAVQDIWMLINEQEMGSNFQAECLLEGYEQFRRFDRKELKLIEPLRTLRQIHYCAWLASRRNDPAFATHFDWFGTVNYWNEQIGQLTQQIERMCSQ